MDYKYFSCSLDVVEGWFQGQTRDVIKAQNWGR